MRFMVLILQKSRITPFETLEKFLNVLGKPYNVRIKMSEPKFKECCEEPLRKEKITYEFLPTEPIFNAKVNKRHILKIHRLYLEYKEETKKFEELNIREQLKGNRPDYDLSLKEILWMDARKLPKTAPEIFKEQRAFRRTYEVKLEVHNNNLNLSYYTKTAHPPGFAEDLKKVIKEDETATLEIEGKRTGYKYNLKYDEGWIETETKKKSA